MPNPLQNPQKSKLAFNVNNEGDVAEMYIYAAIGDSFWSETVSAKSVLKEMKAIAKTKPINVYINSPGGSAFDGNAIYNQLKRHKGKVTCYIDGMALSIASVIALAGDEVVMADNAMYMIHDPSCFTGGGIEEHERSINMLKACKETIVGVYTAKTGMTAKEAEDYMAAETWFTAAEALELGFVDTIGAAKKVENSFDLSLYKNAPEEEACAVLTETVTIEEVLQESTPMSSETPTLDPKVIAEAVEARMAEVRVEERKVALNQKLTASRLEAVDSLSLTPAQAEGLEATFKVALTNAGSLAELELAEQRIDNAFAPTAKPVVEEQVSTPVAQNKEATKMEFAFNGVVPDTHEPVSFIGDKFAKHLVENGKYPDYASACNALFTDADLNAKLMSLVKDAE